MFGWFKKKKAAKVKAERDQELFDQLSKKLEGYESDNTKSIFKDGTDIGDISEYTWITIQGKLVKVKKTTMNLETNEDTWWDKPKGSSKTKDVWSEANPGETGNWHRDDKGRK